MNRGLVAKTFLECRFGAVLFTAGMAVVMGLLSFVLPSILGEYGEQILKMQFVMRMVGALLGTGAIEGISPQILSSFAWVHPIVLATLWGHAITFFTRVPAGELDRGTIDILLGLPVSRMSVLIADGFVCAVSGMIVVVAACVGNLIGSAFALPDAMSRFGPMFMIAANMYAMYLAVAGITCFVSALSDRRGQAVGIAFVIVLASFLLNFLAQFWPVAKTVGFASLLHYYRPLNIVQTGDWPARNIFVFLTIAVCTWSMGATLFARRDLRTS